jgi:hypothetical protein
MLLLSEVLHEVHVLLTTGAKAGSDSTVWAYAAEMRSALRYTRARHALCCAILYCAVLLAPSV